MARFNAIVVFVLSVVALVPPHETRGQCDDPDPNGPVIVQLNPSSPQLWCLQQVGQNTWDLTVQAFAHEDPTECIGYPTCAPTSFTVERRTTNQTVIIRDLIILRPQDSAEGVSIRLGNSYNMPYRLESVSSIWTHEQGEDQRDGHVSVVAYLVGSLGRVDNVNALVVNAGGDIGGQDEPINCVMHPDSPPELDPNERNSFVDLFSSSGSLLGDVTMLSSPGSPSVRGVIRPLDFYFGTIGAGENEPVHIRADGAIAAVYAEEIHAHIGGTGDGAGSFVHLLGALETNSSGYGTGAFTGSIRAERACSSDQYSKNYEQFLVFNGEMRGRIWIQELPGYWISMPPEGLVGTISLGALEPGEEVWDGPIALTNNTYDPTPQNSPHYFTSADAGGYDTPAAELGGGAVGVVPFRLHRNDCWPYDGETVDPNDARPDANHPIIMRHYGPVAWDPQNGTPFVVARRKAGSNDTWQNQECFTQTPDSNNCTIVKLTPSVALQRGFEYQVSRRMFTVGQTQENVLRSDLPHLDTADDPEVFDYDPLVFQVCDATPPGALGDANDDGIVDQYDASSVLTNWGSTACLKFGDADRNGGVNGGDLEIVELYQEWEYCYASGQSFGGAAPKAGTPGLAFGETGAPSTTLGFEGAPASSGQRTITQAVQLMGWADIADFSDSYDGFNEAQRSVVRALLMALIAGE